MEKVSVAEFEKGICEYFVLNSGLTIAKAKALIKANIVKDEFNNSIKCGNVRLFYTDNVNFCGGVKNGFGKGFYLTNSGKNHIKV